MGSHHFANIHFPNNGQGEKKTTDALATNKALLLQKTHAQGRKICWNKELNKKSILQLGEAGKMSCCILKLKKKIKKRTYKLTWDSLW